MASANSLKESLYPIIEKNLAVNTNKLKIGIEKFLDRNMEELSKIGPMKQIIFTEEDKNFLFDCCGVTRNDIEKAIKNSSGYFGQIASNPIYIVLVLCIIYYKNKKDTKMTRMCIAHLTLVMYVMLFPRFWQYKPNEDVMAYTINNLSNKFKIKNEGNLLNSLVSTAELSDKTYSTRIMKATDNDIVYYINALFTRVRSFLRKIANEFYKNKENNYYMGTEVDNPDPDNYRESDSASFAVERYSNSVITILMGGPDMRLLNFAAGTCKVSKNELRNYMNKILIQENIEDVKELINSLLQIYIYDEENDPKSVKTNEFLLFSLEMYKKSNTNNQNINKIKSILDKWMKDIDLYKKTQRLATINNFRRAVYTFFVYSIMIYA